MKEWLINIGPYLIAIIGFITIKGIASKGKKKNWESWATPYEKKLRKQWEAEQQEQATFRQAAAKIPQQESYEEFRARKLAEQEVGEKKP